VSLVPSVPSVTDDEYQPSRVFDLGIVHASGKHLQEHVTGFGGGDGHTPEFKLVVSPGSGRDHCIHVALRRGPYALHRRPSYLNSQA